MKARRHYRLAGWLALLAVSGGGPAVVAQTAAAPLAPAARSGPAPGGNLEPAVDTSAPSVAPVSPPGSTAAPAAAAQSPGVAKAGAAEPGAATGKAAASRTGSRPTTGRAMDRVDLDSSQITGNRELPRVLYIVPWRAPAAGELEGRPVNSLLNELTRPVDRDVFRRENRYFDALQAQSPNADANAAAPPGEK